MRVAMYDLFHFIKPYRAVCERALCVCVISGRAPKKGSPERYCGRWVGVKSAAITRSAVKPYCVNTLNLAACFFFVHVTLIRMASD